ncbi:MAG: XRE family transcriptional regulator [Proteobacteria bacterium]|nr:XRE family transcriptional regulator [Pseudomonadota bacterium]
MTGRHKFAKLRAKMTPARRARNALEAAKLDVELSLEELRRSLNLSQQALADALEVEQPAVARMEKRTDMYVSSLRRMVEAMGGELELIARFPEGSVKITKLVDAE